MQVPGGVTWHPGAGFRTGTSWASAILTAPVTSSQVRTLATDANRVWLRPTAKVRPLWPAVIREDGDLAIDAVVTCRGPWLLTDMGVSYVEPERFVGGSVAIPGLACDGTQHRVQIVIEPVSYPDTERPGLFSFEPGPATIRLSVGLQALVYPYAWFSGYQWGQDTIMIRRG